MDYTSDAYLDWLHRLVDVATRTQQFLMLVLLGLLFARFLLPFLTCKKRYAYLCGFGYFLLFLLLHSSSSVTLPTSVNFLIDIAVGFLLQYAVDRRNPLQKLFLAMAYISMNSLFVVMTADQSGLLSDWLFQSTFLNRSPEATIALYFIMQAEYLLFYAAGMGLGIFLLHKAYRYKQDALGARDFLVLAIPPVFFRLQIMLYLHEYNVYTDYFQALADSNQNEALASMSWSSGLRFFDYGVAFAFLVVYVWVYFDLKRQHKEGLAASVRREQMEQLSERTRQVERMYGEMQGLRHDMNHHMMVIGGLVERQDWENASAYLKRIGDELAESRPAVVTGHPVTDVILAEKKREAESRGIAFDCDFQFPAGRGIDAFDISVLLGNALNNAVAGALAFSGDVVGGNGGSLGGSGDEGGSAGSLAIGHSVSSATETEKNGNGDSVAIAETPFISVRSFVKDNMYLIEVKNSFCGEWEIDRDSGFPLSTKSGERHGIGLYNMRSIARKYRGDISLERDNGIVELTVLVQMGEGR